MSKAQDDFKALLIDIGDPFAGAIVTDEPPLSAKSLREYREWLKRYEAIMPGIRG